MKRLLASMALTLLLTPVAWARGQMLSGYTLESLDAATVEYGVLFGTATGNVSATEADVQGLLPIAGDFKTLRVNIPSGSALGAGDSFTFTVRDDGVDTALTCTISEAETSCTDDSNVISAAAASQMNIEITPAGTPPADVFVAYSMLFVASVPEYKIFMGGSDSGTVSTTADRFLAPVGQDDFFSLDTQTERAQLVVDQAVTMRNLYVEISAAPGAGANRRDYWVRQNDTTDTAVTVRIAGTTEVADSDTANTAALAAADTWGIKTHPFSTPTSASADIGVVMEFVGAPALGIASQTTGLSQLHTSGTEYYRLWAAEDGGNATEGFSQTESPGFTATGIRVDLETAPGAGTTWSFTLRKDGADTDITCSISGASATTCSDTGTAKFSRLEKASTEVTVTAGTPTATEARISYTVVRRNRVM